MFDMKNEKIKDELIEEATIVLDQNSKNGMTMPSRILYPHQWFWDSCFIAIGLRHIDTERAKTCLLYTSPSPRDGLLSRMPSSA